MPSNQRTLSLLLLVCLVSAKLWENRVKAAYVTFLQINELRK